MSVWHHVRMPLSTCAALCWVVEDLKVLVSGFLIRLGATGGTCQLGM